MRTILIVKALIGDCRRLCLGAAAMFVLAACGAGETDTGEVAPPVRPAKLITIEAHSEVISMELPAVIDASLTSALSFEIGGKVETLDVMEGVEVERGAVIARLNQRDIRNQLTQARAQFDNAKAEFDRAERLINENAISRSVFEQRKTQMDVAKASYDVAQKRLDDTVLRAPFSGVIADVHIERFDNVGPQQAIVTLQTTGDAEAVVQAPARIVANQEQLEPIETWIELDAAPGVRVPAEIHSFSTLADASTQTFEAKFAFTPPENITVLPSMTGTLHGKFKIVGDTDFFKEDYISVPLSAVQSDGEETYVWVVDPETMSVSRRSIQVKSRLDDYLSVLEGLEVGEQIVGAGGAYLQEGVKIRAYEP